jgi:hypothetical protein
MIKASKFDLTEMRALFAAPPILATESADQFEKIFDHVAASLNVQDMMELILIRDSYSLVSAVAGMEDARSLTWFAMPRF